jgi:hypothetical protein
VQPAGHAQAGLVEPGHFGVDDVVFDLLEELAQPVGGSFGHGRQGGLRDWGAKQCGQRLCGAFFGQELPPRRRRG